MYIARSRCESQQAVGLSGLNARWSKGRAVEFKFSAWSSIAQSVCQRAFSLLEIRFQRPWVEILHSAEEDNLSSDSKIACLCQSIEINNSKHAYTHTFICTCNFYSIIYIYVYNYIQLSIITYSHIFMCVNEWVCINAASVPCRKNESGENILAITITKKKKKKRETKFPPSQQYTEIAQLRNTTPGM